MRCRSLVAALALTLTGGARVASAESQCRVVDVDYMPAAGANADVTLRKPLSIVAWLETPGGEFVETVFITQQVGIYGLGNRPGRFDFNSGPDWPYGRRVTTFPVWAHRHGLDWDELVFQDGNDSGLSHGSQFSSKEKHYFRPLMRTEPGWDAETHASSFGPYTDKGKFGTTKSLYPPRQDVIKTTEDAASVAMYDQLNPFDAVSQASPQDGVMSRISWAAPKDLPTGDYVLWMEVSREFDQNSEYSVARYPSPHPIPYEEYGVAYRGQPSVLYKVLVTMGNTMSSTTATPTSATAIRTASTVTFARPTTRSRPTSPAPARSASRSSPARTIASRSPPVPIPIPSLPPRPATSRAPPRAAPRSSRSSRPATTSAWAW